MDFCLLSKFDDLFSDIFLDAQFLWFDTSKLNIDHRRPRIRSDKVLKIIQDQVLATGKTNEAVKELLRMDYFKHYLAAKSTKQQQEFVQHMKRYLYMYMPNAGYEIADTRRYGGAGRRMESCVTVTRDWKMDDEIRLCTGMIALLDPRQEHQLKKGNRDISVMWSSRKQRNCLFLGPARFVNHDCDPNAKFISRGHNSVTVKIIKDVKCGDELTVFYGKHYFTESSYECRCATCETKRAGCSGSDDDLDGSSSSESELERGSKKRKSSAYDHDLRRKRSSWEIPKVHRIELEELIGVLEDNEDSADSDDEQHGHSNDNLTKGQQNKSVPRSTSIKQEQTDDDDDDDDEDEDDDDDERPRVMSIHYLCNENDKMRQQQLQQQNERPSSRSPSFCHSPLDLLCNAVLGAEYLEVQPKQEEITVVVSPEIHRDASDRMKRKNGTQYHQQQHQQKWQFMDEDSSSDTKADSAVGLSPQLQHHDAYHQNQTQMTKTSKISPSLSTNAIEKNTSASTKKTGVSKLQWKDSIDSLFDDQQLSELDDFMDDVSDLSSVCSSDITLDSDANNNNNLKSDQPSSSSIPLDSQRKKSKSPTGLNDTNGSQTSTTLSTALSSAIPNKTIGGKPGLNCMACGRALKSETIADSMAVDVAVANELATWTWSPSAAFTDWRPQRCPRCERHVRVFTQEWPLRKIKRKVPFSNNSGVKLDSPSTKSPASKRRPTIKKQPKKVPSCHIISMEATNPTIKTQATDAVSVSRKPCIQPPPTPTSEIFSGVENLF